MSPQQLYKDAQKEGLDPHEAWRGTVIGEDAGGYFCQICGLDIDGGPCPGPPPEPLGPAECLQLSEMLDLLEIEAAPAHLDYYKQRLREFGTYEGCRWRAKRWVSDRHW